MSIRRQAESWISDHRRALWGAWAAVGVVVAGWLLFVGPEVYYLRGIAPWPQRWVVLFFVSVWGWVGLRFIALWIWAWVVLALAPVFLFVPVRFYLDAWWLLPLLTTVVVTSALTVVGVVWWRMRRGDAAL